MSLAYLLYKCFGSSQVITYAFARLGWFFFLLCRLCLMQAHACGNFHNLTHTPAFVIVMPYFIWLVIVFASCWNFYSLMEYHLHFNDYLWANKNQTHTRTNIIDVSYILFVELKGQHMWSRFLFSRRAHILDNLCWCAFFFSPRSIPFWSFHSSWDSEFFIISCKRIKLKKKKLQCKHVPLYTCWPFYPTAAASFFFRLNLKLINLMSFTLHRPSTTTRTIFRMHSIEKIMAFGISIHFSITWETFLISRRQRDLASLVRSFLF